MTLTIDVRAAGRPVNLKGRRLHAVTLVSRKGAKGESAYAAGRAFCRMMCPKPRLAKEPVYGYNDLYCAYGWQHNDNPDDATACCICARPSAVSLRSAVRRRGLVADRWLLAAETLPSH